MPQRGVGVRAREREGECVCDREGERAKEKHKMEIQKYSLWSKAVIWHKLEKEIHVFSNPFQHSRTSVIRMFLCKDVCKRIFWKEL